MAIVRRTFWALTGTAALALTACGGGGGGGGGSTGGSGGTPTPPPAPPAVDTALNTQVTGAPVNFVHDPTIVKIDGRYHLFHTSNDADEAGYIYWRYSDDFINWNFAGAIFAEKPAYALAELRETEPTDDEPGGVWAPHAMVVDDELWVYYSLFAYHASNNDRESLSGLVTIPLDEIDVDNPMSGWVDQGMVINAEPDDRWSAIDVHVLRDPTDDRWWMTFGSYWSGIEIVEVDPATGKPFPAAMPVNIADRNVPPNAIEAPVLVYKDGFYYLFVSKDECCAGFDSTYNVVVGRSQNPLGPYEDADGTLMTQDGGTLVVDASSDPTGSFGGAGHNDIYQEGDDWYIVYHAYARSGLPTLRIHTLLWDEDGWPYIDLENETQPPSAP